MRDRQGKVSIKNLVLFVLVVFLMTGILAAYAADVPIETGIIQQVGENFVTVVIKNGKGFKDGTKLTFYFHRKTKILMARSKTPLTYDSLLVGDEVRITLGKVETMKDGSFKRYADRIVVLTGRGGSEK